MTKKERINNLKKYDVSTLKMLKQAYYENYIDCLKRGEIYLIEGEYILSIFDIRQAIDEISEVLEVKQNRGDN